MISKTKIKWTKFIKSFVLMCLLFSFSAMAQNTNDKPMEAKALANMIKEFKQIVLRNTPDKNEAKLVIEKWDKRTDLAGQTKEKVANLLYEDVKSVIEDYGTQYQISTMFSFYLTIPDKFLSDLDKKNESEKSATDVSKLPADIADWGGQDADKILETLAIKMRLEKLLGENDYEFFSESFETKTPIEKIGNFLFAGGCMIRACTRLESAVAIDLDNKTVHAAIYNEIEQTKYFNEKNSKTPEPIIKWAKRLEDLKKDVEDKPEAILIDSFSYTNREDMMARVDNYVVESQNKPTTSAYIIIRGNNTVRTKTEKELTEYITQNRGLDKNRLFILNADGDKTAEIELWLVPPGAKPPAQEKSVNPNNSVKSQIIALEKQAWEEWKKGNKKFVENYLADDAVFVYTEGVINKSQVVEAVGSCKFNSYSLDDFRVIKLSKTSALVSYTATQDIICNGNSAPKAVRSTSVYVKSKGKWLSTFYTETAEVR